MARKKQKKPAGKKNPKNENNNKASQKRASEAQEFIKNLGPDGYMQAARNFGKDINIEQYSMSTPDGATPLLVDVRIKLDFGKKYGLVGNNGFGKTTLLNNFANYNVEGFPTHIMMLHVLQERAIDHENTVMEAVLKSDIIRTQLLQEAERLEEITYSAEDPEEAAKAEDDLMEINDQMEHRNIKGSHSKAFKILSGLGFDRDMQKSRVESLSGGWRMRVELAKALFVSPDLLLLDEPTNHLDFPAVLWLQEYLANDFKNTLVVVSHDKMFIDGVATNIIHLDHKTKKLDYYRGGFLAFEAAKKERLQTVANEYRAIEVQISAIKEFVEKFKDKGEKRAAQVQSKLKILKKLEDSLPEKPQDPKLFRFSFPEPKIWERNLVSFDDVSFSYVEDKKLLQNVNLTVDMTSRVGVIGANGAGKSTLVKLLLGKLEQNSGKIERDSKTRFAYFSQHHYDQLDLTTSAIEYLLEKFEKELSGTHDRVQMVRRHLGRFGIQGDRQNQKMALLSGGQKSRVAFSAMTYLEPNFIVMDEPTNHLDMETVDALIDALKTFKGGFLVISHDTHFLSNAVNDFWSVTKDKIVRFDDFEDAKEFALRKRIGEADEEDS